MMVTCTLSCRRCLMCEDILFWMARTKCNLVGCAFGAQVRPGVGRDSRKREHIPWYVDRGMMREYSCYVAACLHKLSLLVT